MRSTSRRTVRGSTPSRSASSWPLHEGRRCNKPSKCNSRPAVSVTSRFCSKLRTGTVLNAGNDVFMTNPYVLRLLAQAQEEDLRRAFVGRQNVRRQAHVLRDLRSALFGWRRPRHAQAPLRVVRSPLEPSAFGGQTAPRLHCR